MRNVFDNAQNLDLALNDITSSFWSDRLGRSRMSWFGLESAFTVKLSDFESRFSTQIAEQETTFDASQADKENRFQAFLDSSGYVFLGDYEDGPFQFIARNQYIRYNNQYYRLNAATDVGFTTTGTDATSFANDVTHFVLMDGDTIRQNLGSGDGQKLVGKCATLDALRTTEPEYHGQEIILFRAVVDGPALNERLYYDATDTTSEENGFSVFVTPNGARWKADVSEGYNVFLAGFSPSENNLAQCIHKINAWIVAKAIAASRINDRKATILIPGLIDSGGATVYTMTGDVHFCAALVELVPLTLQFWDFSNSFDVPILCSNEFEGLRGGMGNSYNG
ncbi:hypothetical protein ACUIG6_28385, partial [Raoultella ornithinolytica]